MEIIKLNLIPRGVNPTCHCSQYDEGRVIRIELFDGLTPYVLQSGDTVTLNVRKPDNTIVTGTVSTTQGNNYVDIVTTEQICACVGYNLCDLTITNGSKIIGTLNFIMAVERDVLADGIPSQSVIEDLDELVQEAVGDNYYTKEETDEQIDDALKDVYPLGEASGAIASFNTDVILPLKYLKAEINATETGSGEKSPSNPYTINGFSQADITGCGYNLWDEEWESGKYNATTGLKEPDANTIRSKNYIPIVPNKTYRFVNTGTDTYTRIVYCDISKNVISVINDTIHNGSEFTTPSNAFYLCFSMGSAYGTTYGNNISINYPSSDISYHAYTGKLYTVVFGQTVYGGRLIYENGAWSIEATRGVADLGTLNWSYDSANARFYTSALASVIKLPTSYYDKMKGNCEIYKIVEAVNWNTNLAISLFPSGALFAVDSNYTDVTAFTTAISGKKLVYELATPVIIPITSDTRVKTVIGENNIFTNTNGDIDVFYHHALTAKNIYFDNSGTELQADNVEDAIKEILTLIQGGNNSRALNLSKGSLKVETPVSNEEPAIEEPTVEEDPITEEETATEEPVKAEELTTEEDPETVEEPQENNEER